MYQNLLMNILDNVSFDFPDEAVPGLIQAQARQFAGCYFE